ncbi:FMN-binding protein [Anoxynatronum sibiricum]|uniref:FMN-binding protein n=1 Tax=Anoxynatronum sibiricum TaxID=210623 RepID=A0ABU9VTV5_9CLOT
MKKHGLVIMIILLTAALLLTGCGDTGTTPAETPATGGEASTEPAETAEAGEESQTEAPAEAAGDYDDGTYRGNYNDSGVMQVGVQFRLTEGVISDVRYRHLSYSGTDYNALEEGDPFHGIKLQHQQVADYLEGKPVTAINDLYAPGDFVEDVDTFTGATIRGNKIFSAFQDALNRGVYGPDNGVTRSMGSYDDGTYRGIYSDAGEMQVSIQFKLANNTVSDVRFRHLAYGGTDFNALEESDALYGILSQHEQIVDYLEGRELEQIFDLYVPGDFIEDVDTFTGATIRGNKVFSAMKDALNRGLYQPAGSYNTAINAPDGRYRGTYEDSGEQQVSIQFNIENGNFTDIRFRHLAYGGVDYNEMEAGDPFHGILQQYEQAAAYLEGKPAATIFELHAPGDFVEDVDTFSGATLRGNKMFSAIMDGLNRGIY